MFITPNGEDEKGEDEKDQEELVVKFGDAHVDINKKYQELVDYVLYRTIGLEYDTHWTKNVF